MRLLPNHNYSNPYSTSSAKWAPKLSKSTIRKVFNLKTISSILNTKIRTPARLIVLRLWMILILVIISLGIIISKATAKSKLTLSELMELPFEERYTPASLDKLPMSKRPIFSESDQVFEYGCRETETRTTPRMNAAFVVLARNSEIDGVVSSMKSLERHFNQWYNYPWVFLNNEKFSKDFKKRVAEVSSGGVRFGFIPQKQWDFPEGVEGTTEFNEAIENQGDREIMYGNMKSYHKMCRFYSGYFFNHPLVSKLEYYWRVEPDVDFYCDLTYDPFYEMKLHNKSYGFTIMIKELLNTVPNLFRYTKAFIRERQLRVPDSFKLFETDFKTYKSLGIGENNKEKFYEDTKNKETFFKRVEMRTPVNRALKLVNQNDKDILENIDSRSLNALVDHSNKQGLLKINKNQYNSKDYNLCHFWSNFEIARTDLYRSLEYQQYFQFLEDSKGFFTERWGDAPIHSLAAGMFLNLTEIHYFRDIGYKHSTLGHCPKNHPTKQLPYKPSSKYTGQYNAQEEKYWLKYDKPTDDEYLGVGCRCRCPSDHKEIEDSGGSCISLWSELNDDERTEKKYFDIDSIEMRALEMYEEHLINGKPDGEWHLSSEDIEELSLLLV